MLNFNEVNNLGQIIDTTWGKSSTPISPSMSIKAFLEGDVMKITYTVVINLLADSPFAMRNTVSRYEDESIKVVNEVLKDIKSQFKELSGRALKTKELSSTDNVEMITFSAYSPKRTAYYRRFVNLQCE